LAEQRTDTLTELEERYAGYKVYDRDGEKIGKVEYLFVDENDQHEYVGVKMGFLGTKSTLVPMDIVREDEDHRVIEVTETKDKIKGGPAFDDEEEITPEYEERVRSHYGLGSLKDSGERGAYQPYYSDASGDGQGDLQPSKRTLGIRERSGEDRLSMARGSTDPERITDLGDKDDFSMHRIEEELAAGTRKREVGAVRLRKRVSTEREQLRVPKRREEVHVDRVPVNREAPEAEIGEDEFFVPVTEEEVIVEKKPVAKEEIRLRKEIVEEEEVVERDVRKEQVDIDDETERRAVLEHDHDVNNERRRRSA
jgi:uncharacterized protein (TIGR02271 family)